MKKLLTASAIAALVATGASAGSLADATVEAPVVVQETASSSANGIIVPVILLALVAAAVSNN